MTKTFLAHITEMANKKLAAMEEEIVRQQAEINRLRETLKNICITAKRGKSSQLFTPETAVLSSIENDCLIALDSESEER